MEQPPKNNSVREFFDSLAGVEHPSLPEGLTFHSTFTANGKQGMVGLIEYQGEQYVYKISQYLNYLASHEGTIMTCLEKIADFCPHFCKTVGRFTTSIEPNFRKVVNPFEIQSKYPVYSEVLVMEYLSGTRKFYRYLKKKSMDEDVLYSLIQQTLCALLASQQHCSFTHYDLHSNNIMVQECDSNQVSIYRVSENQVFIIPTYGFIPIIIDYGFSYCQDLDKKPVWGALAHTDVGFMSNTFDKWADFKLFLITVGYEMESYHRKGSGREFRKLIKKIFKPLSVDWESGWDESDEMSASDYAMSLLEEDIESEFFEECIHFCTDILQTLTCLPLEPHPYEDIVLSYKLVEKEFMKIEDEIKSKFYLLYIFKSIVDCAGRVSKTYLRSETRQEAVKTFRHCIYDTLNKVSKYAKPKINYEKLLCSLLLLGRQISGVVYDVCRERMKEKRRDYKKMDVKSPVEILEKIHSQFGSHEWEADDSTYFQVYDFMQKKSYRLDITDKMRDTFNEGDKEERREMILSVLR